jgi:D-alanyl-lipoteichoic acid acyltransferase DltB (MBOAT superfamily)
VVTPRSEAEYDSLPLYLAYALYTPLYVAGPIMSFNSFASQVRHRLYLSSCPATTD